MMIIQPYNPGMILEKMPEDVFHQLEQFLLEKRKNSDKKNNRRKNTLQILSIKEIDDTPYVKDFDSYLRNFFQRWCSTFKVECYNYDIRTVWTNYMKPGEFAPMHKHSPAIASFVIWIKIPYSSKEEKIIHYDGEDLDHTNRNGAFEFLYSKYNGQTEVHRMDLSKVDEGSIFMFPGDLMHCVYPFFSKKEERISIAGNFYSLDQIEIY